MFIIISQLLFVRRCLIGLKNYFTQKLEILFVCYIINGHASTLSLFLKDKNTRNYSIAAKLILILRWNIRRYLLYILYALLFEMRLLYNILYIRMSRFC